MAAQIDLAMDPNVAAVLTMFARNNRSAKRIGEELRAVAQYAYDEAIKPAEDIFGPAPRASRADVLGRLNEQSRPPNLEVPGRQQPVRGDLRPPAPDAAAEADGAGTEAGRPAADQAAQDLAEAPTAEPFTTNGQALVYAAQNGIAGKVKSVEVTGGWALVPKERAPSVLTAEADAKALDAANTALAKSGWKTPAGKPWKLKPAKNVPPIFKTVAAIIDAAFGVRVQAVNGAPGNGLQFRRGAFVDTARVTSPETLIGVTGHEVKHWFDANDKATGAKLDQAIEQHLKAGAVQAQMARENAQLVAGEAPMTEAGARLELLSDINGALWLDPDFWGRLYDIDSSAFRKVLYQFMRAATKFIKVAQGSTFDLTAYVDNVAAVRDAAAQAMVERAENRRGKAGPQMLVKNARRGRPSPLDQDLFAQPAAEAAAPSLGEVIATGLSSAAFDRWLKPQAQRTAAQFTAIEPGVGYFAASGENKGFRSVAGVISPRVVANDTRDQRLLYRMDDGSLVWWREEDGTARKVNDSDPRVELTRDVQPTADTKEVEAAVTVNGEEATALFPGGIAQVTDEQFADVMAMYGFDAPVVRAFERLRTASSAPTPAQADDFNLTAPTRGDVLAQQQARADETKAEAARRRARDEADRKDRERRDIADRARQDASAENFVLGQNADEALAGQNSLFEPDAPYETDLFGNPLPAAAARGRGSRRDRQAAQAGDVLAQPGVQGQEAPRGRYATRTQLVTTRQQTLGHAGPIRSLADAAHALSYLGKSAVERLDVLVTDAKDRPLAVVGGFKGAIDMAPVYKGTLVGEVMRIPDAANLWMVHNHPSGKSLLSRADELLLEQMAGAFAGTAIRPRAIIALGRQEWSGVDEAGTPDRRQPMKPAQAGPIVPAQERRIEVDELLGPEINSPTNAKEAVKAHTDYFMGQSGILLLNKQQAPLAFVPWRAEDAMPLKDNGKLDALYRAVSVSNAATAIIATGSSMPIRSAQNLAAGLARIDVNTLDIIDSSGTSAAERGEVINPGILMSRAAAPDFANETDQSKIVNAIDLTATPEEKVAQLVRMTEDNAPIVKALLERIDAAFGVKSKDNRKDPANILSKASRPSILAKKPWHGVEHIRDSYRFKTDLQSITQLPGIVRMLEESGVQIIKRDVDKLLEPQEWGWRIVAFDLRMPNGQLVEYYLPVSEMEAAKKAKGHLLFEEWRNLDQASLTPEQLAQRAVTVQESRDLYQAAWDAYLARTGDSEGAIRAALSSAAAASPSTRLYRSSSRLPSLTDGAGETQTPAALRMAENLPSNTKAADEPSESTQPNAADLPTGFIASSFGSSIPPTAQPAGAEYARLADPFAENYARLEGRKVSFDVRIEDTGQTATFTVDAAQYLRELDQRRDVARRLADCVAR